MEQNKFSDVKLENAMERIASGECITVPDDVYDKGCIHSMKDGLAAAIKIGFPVMIKASEGGKEICQFIGSLQTGN